MSQRQKPSWMCLVLMWRFHSFLDVKDAWQLYWAKQHGNGRQVGGAAFSSMTGRGWVGCAGLRSGSFGSATLTSALVSTNFGSFG
jgi:hypothetical protein